MSNDLAIPTDQLPAYLQGFQGDTNESLITSGVVLPRISLRGKQFRFKKDGNEQAMKLGQSLRVVVLGATPRQGCSKAYYAESYSEGSDEPPTCSSSDGVTPDSWIGDPINSACANCPNNAFGSGTDSNGNPTKGKACADTKRLLVLPPDNPKGDIWMLQVPPASLKALSNFGSQLAKHSIPIETVITEIFFEDAEYPKIGFKYSGFIEEKVAPSFLERVNSDEVRELMDAAMSEAPQQASTGSTTDDAKSMPETVEEVFGEEDGDNPAIQLPDGSYAVDASGTAFSANDHVKARGKQGGSVDKQGMFKPKKKKETTKVSNAAPENTQEAPPSMFADSDAAMEAESEGDYGSSDSQAELDAVLDSWGS